MVMLLLVSSVVVGQDFREAVLEVRKVYGQVERLHAVIDIKVYVGASSLKPYYAEVADIRRDKQNCRYHYGTNDMLMNEKYLVLVDRSAKEMSVSKRNLKGEAALRSDPVQVNLDSLLKHYDQAIYAGREGNADHYKLVRHKGEPARTDIFIDVQTKLVRRIEYHYREGQRVFIDFKVFDLHPQFEPDTFQEKHFFSVTKGKIVAADQFKGYTISGG